MDQSTAIAQGVVKFIGACITTNHSTAIALGIGKLIKINYFRSFSF